MGRLVGDLLLLARADAGELPSMQWERVDLAELAAEVIDRARPTLAERRLSLAGEAPCVVMGDRDRLKQMIANLVENAIRYTPSTGRIDVRVSGGPHAPGVQQPGRSARSRSARDSGESTRMALLS